MSVPHVATGLIDDPVRPEATGGIDPGRGSFTIALNAARDLLTQAANVIAGTIIDLTGAIGRRVLDNLLPDRRLRVSPASSNARYPNTRPEAPTSTGAATKPPSASTSPRPDLDTPHPEVNYMALALVRVINQITAENAELREALTMPRPTSSPCLGAQVPAQSQARPTYRAMIGIRE